MPTLLVVGLVNPTYELALLPTLAEELKATARGNKLAKELLTPELYKKVVKSNKLGAITYILTFGTAAIGAWAGNKIADYIRKSAN